MNAKEAWKKALQTLQTEIPKAQFDTWVRDAELIAFEEGVARIGVQNAYARDWLAERLGDKITQRLRDLLDQDVDVRFALAGGRPEADAVEQEEQPLKPDIAIQAKEYETVYEQVVLPHRQAVVPGYFRRHLRVIGPKMAWMYLAFRQLAYQQGARSGVESGTYAGKQIAALCGISDRTFWYRVESQKTWEKLKGLVTHIETEPQWQDGEEPHRLPLQYQVAMTLPLTAADARSLTFWLRDHLEQFGGPEGVVDAACQTPLEDLIPLDAKADGWEPMSVRDVINHLFSSAVPDGHLETLASKLQNQIMPPKQDTIHVTLFFMEHILPHLSAGEAWLLTLLRDRCYVNRDTGEVRNTVTVKGGYKEMANWLGFKRPKTIGDWLADSETVLKMYLHHQKGNLAGEHTFHIRLEEIPSHLLAVLMDEKSWEIFKTAMQAFIDGEDPEQVWEQSMDTDGSVDGNKCQHQPARLAVLDGRDLQYRPARLAVLNRRDLQYR